MKSAKWALSLVAGLLATAHVVADEPEEKVVFPSFRVQEIEKNLEVGYAALLADIDGDGKKDVVIVDTTRIYWYENPSWKKRTILDGGTRRDNVCIDAYDIDGDGRLDLALGADWKGLNSKAGTLQWLRRGKTLDEPWTVYPIDTEPSVHRIRFADVDGSGKPALVVGPLLGKNSTAEKNWMDGAPVRMLAYRIPKDPTRDRWLPEVIDQSLHVVHNFWPVPRAGGKGMDILTASYEGVNLLTLTQGKWQRKHVGKGNQDNPKGKRGASEIKQGTLKGGRKFLATIEPWHGDQVVVYTEPSEAGALWDRHVIDEQLRWGHAVWCADLDGDGGDELIIGVRDDPAPADKGIERRGVRIYKAQGDKGTRWARKIIDSGGVAVEDLAAADFDGDGKIDIVAAGRQTKNARIYWNLGNADPGKDGAQEAALRKAVTLYASFDEAVRGDVGGGDLTLATRSNHPTRKGEFVFEKGFDEKVFRIARDKGISGGALEVLDVLPDNGRIFFPAKGNIAFKKGGWGGAVSFWIDTDPNKLLKTPFCDPVQITQKGANNGGIWFDFNDAKPRDARMGVFPAVAEGEKAIAESDPKAPLVRVPRVDFKQGQWQHVVLSWQNLDTGKADAHAELFINGKLIGHIKDRPLAMDWDLDKAGIYVAVNFIGLLDELAVFDRPLTQEEIQLLRAKPGVLDSLKRK